MSKLSLRTEGDTVVVVTRRFAAPPAEVFRAHTEPALLQQWCLGPDGWTMPVCVCDALTRSAAVSPSGTLTMPCRR